MIAMVPTAVYGYYHGQLGPFQYLRGRMPNIDNLAIILYDLIKLYCNMKYL